LKVLYVIGDIRLRSGGTTAVAVEMAEALARRGVSVSLFAAGSEDESLIPEGVDVRLFPLKAPRRWCYCPQMEEALREMIPQVDAVHIHGLWLYPGMISARLSKRFGKPYLLTPHGMLEKWALNQGLLKSLKKRLYALLVERDTLNSASAVQAVSSREIASIRSFGVRSRVVLIPNGICVRPADSLPPRGLFRRIHPSLEGKKVVLFLGRLHFKKGLDILIESFERLSRNLPDARLVVAGPDDGYGEIVARMIKKKRLSHLVTLTGILRGRQKYSAFVDSDLFVLPSRSEGFPRTVLEAMLAGLPVVVSEGCNFPEVVEEGAGFVLGLDAGAFAEAMGRVLLDEHLRSTLARNARRFVTEKFSWDEISLQLLRLYEEVLNGKRSFGPSRG